MAETDTSGAGGAMWAVTTLMIVVLVLAVLYFSGVLGNRSAVPSKVDVKIDTPAR